jgi:hypothetical protein
MKSGCVFRFLRAGNGKCKVVGSPLARGIRVWASKEGLPNRRSAYMRLRNRGALREGPSIQVSADFGTASTDLGHV